MTFESLAIGALAGFVYVLMVQVKKLTNRVKVLEKRKAKEEKVVGL